MLLTTCAAGFAEDQTWSHVWDTNKSNGGEGFYHTTGDETTLTTTMKGIEWTLISETPSVAFTASAGQMIGTATKPASNVSLFTNGIEGVIKSVEVEVKVKDAVQVADVAVEVDGTSYLCGGSATQQMTADYVKYNFVPAAEGAQGKIDIKMTQTGETKGALFIKSILEIDSLAVYEKDGETPFVSFDKFRVNADPLRMLTGTVAVSEIYLKGLYTRVLQHGDRFNFTDILEFLAKGDTTSTDSIAMAADSVAADSAGMVNAAEIAEGLPFNISVENIMFEKGNIIYQDTKIGSKIHLQDYFC